MPARIVLAAILLTGAFPALAQDPPLPPLTPGGAYRVMTQDDATSTSDCIGNPVTPLCAVETVMAVNVRGKLDYRRIAMGLEGGPLFDERGWGSPIIYRIVRVDVLTDEAFPWSPESDLNWRPGGLTMQAGDLRIDIASMFCFTEISFEACGGYWSSPITYIVRPMGDRWIVVTWGDSYDRRQ